MCLIIDSNIAHYFARPIRPAAIAVLDWIQKKGGCIVYGGKLATELQSVGDEVKSLIINLDRAGRAKRVSAGDVDAETDSVKCLGCCCSNDAHVIALARLTGARVLFSHDVKLHSDFKNAKLVSDPRGHVYQTEAHVALLKHTASCIGRPEIAISAKAKRKR